MSRVLIAADPFDSVAQIGQGSVSADQWSSIGEWPAFWIDHPDRPIEDPSVAMFRCSFSVDHATTVRVHVTADNRYRLLLDGIPVGRGPERGDPLHWRYETYDLNLSQGTHTLVAMTWWLGKLANYAQMSIRPGFMLAAEGRFQDALCTGIAAWESCLVRGVEFISPGVAWGTGARVRIHGDEFPWDWQKAEGGDWRPTAPIAHAVSAALKNEIEPYWLLVPATLPAMMEEPQQSGTVRYLTDDKPYPVASDRHLRYEAPAWQNWLHGQEPVSIPAHTTRCVVIDLEGYFCAYPLLKVSGGSGSRIRLQWAEALYEQPEACSKGNRNEIEGKYFCGNVGDEFCPDGSMDREFFTLWWEAGRYIEITIVTDDEPITLISLVLKETRYPMEMEGRFQSSDPRLEEVIPIAVRALQMCSHETYMDCPYYEQLMYIGDTRLEALSTYAITRDDRLPRKALEGFDASRRLNGITASRYPSRVAQIIPPFTLWWMCMVHDYWMWRNDPNLVHSLLPGIRAAAEYFRTLIGHDGVMTAPNGWNFTDWVKDPMWRSGVPENAQWRPSSIHNLQFILSLIGKAEMEAAFGEPLLAERDRRTAQDVMNGVIARFWNEERGVLANDIEQTGFSEHAQCLAILSGLLPIDRHESVVKGLLNRTDLACTTIYFTHYLFETLYRLGRGDLILERLRLWFALKTIGFKTTFEEPEPSRSDCHAWGAHPLYHYQASLLGIRPMSPGFKEVRIAPQPGSLKELAGTLPHPAGVIDVHLRQISPGIEADISLPDGVSGVFVWHNVETPLKSGKNSVRVE